MNPLIKIIKEVQPNGRTYYITDTSALRALVNESRSTLKGNGFSVLNAADGFRKDNSLWFGTCSECGESVTNSSLNGVWKHTLVLEVRANGSTSRQIDYCPKVGE
jgi:hypothetical protein